MSTDNVGVDDARRAIEDVLAGGETTDNVTPTFLVEVNEGGKFKRLRPRQVK
jgi:hypothetical protein